MIQIPKSTNTPDWTQTSTQHRGSLLFTSVLGSTIVYSSSLLSIYCGNSPLTNPGIAWQLRLLTTTERSLTSGSSEKCSIAKSFGLVKSSVQSAFLDERKTLVQTRSYGKEGVMGTHLNETQSLSTLRTSDFGESTFVHAPKPSPSVTLRGVHVPVPLGPEQAWGTTSARTASF